MFARCPTLVSQAAANASRSVGLVAAQNVLKSVVSVGMAGVSPDGDITVNTIRGLHQTVAVAEAASMPQDNEKLQQLRRVALQEWLDGRELKLSPFAQAIGKSQSQLSDTMNGNKPFGEKLALSIEKAVREKMVQEMPTGYLVNPSPRPGFDGLDSADKGERPEGTPVVGTAKLGPDGLFYELERPVGFGDGRVRYVSKDNNAYSVRVVGDSMAPRIRSGEFVVCEPGHTYRAGDDVLVFCNDGRKMVKEFLYQRGDVVVLESVNAAHGRITLRTDEIEKIHYVVAVTKDSSWEPE
jgi:phage repressor protein C with HTH and peptisase S24 domain